MKTILKPFLFVYSVYVALLYFISLMIAVPLVILSYALLNEIRGHLVALGIIRIWSITWATLCGIRMKVIDRHKTPPSGCYVFVCNHTSNLDAMLWGWSNIYLVKGLAKRELMKVPMLGYIFRKTCVIVDRGSKESRQESVKELKDTSQKNISIFVFPEGTRNRTDKPLKSFYDGAFRMAIELQKPIAPLVMCNTGLLMPPGSLMSKPGTVKTVFLDHVPTAGLTENDIEPLKQKVFAMMEQALLQHDARFAGKN